MKQKLLSLAIAIVTVVGLMGGCMYLGFNLGAPSSIAYAQRQDTIYQTLLTNVTTAPVSTANVRNIGQPQHHAVLQLTAQPAKTCTSQQVDISFKASYDNINFFEIGTPVTSVNRNNALGLFGILEADGAYPFVKLTVASFDTTNCQITVNYTGTIFPNPASVAMLPNYQARNINQESYNITTNGADQNLIVNPYSTRFIVVYGFTLNTSANQQITIKCGAGINKFFVYTANTTPYILPPVGIPTFVCGRGLNLILHDNGGAEGASGNIAFRFEDNP